MLVVLQGSQTPEITRLKEEKLSRVMKIHSGLFSDFLSVLPLIISAFNSCRRLKGAVSLKVAYEVVICTAEASELLDDS